MGIVYRAIDRQTGLPVAVKMMARLDPVSAERFDREARILAELSHPRIVRYVAHGKIAAGQYIAMEWLEGETLHDRLLRGPLAPQTALAFLETVAGALAVVHARGVVHRDMKPSNLFLVDGDLQAVKLLDFGIARAGLVVAPTRSGAVMGTPGYVAPEQAQGSRGVDSRADVFALGAVLYECLTGQPVFKAGNVMALLAKILLEEAPRARELNPDVPVALDALVARLLAKDPVLRPRDAAEVLEELQRIADPDAPTVPPAPKALTAGEQRVLSVIVATLAPVVKARPPTQPPTQVLDGAAPPDGWDDAPPPAPDDWNQTRPLDAPEEDRPPPEPTTSPAVIRTEFEDDRQRPLRAAAEVYGGSLEQLADGSLVVTLKGAGAATDQAARAARCALALREILPEVPMAIATGRGMLALRFPVGDVIEHAARLLREVAGAEPTRSGGRRSIRIDETTAGLLDGRFETGGDRRGLELLGERADEDSTRTLLGKQSPFIGREREMGFLGALYDECVAEPMARPALVTAPPGAGKSRLAQELRARLAKHAQPPEVWMARGDPTRAGSPFGLLAPAIRRVAGIFDGEALAVRQQKLRARVARRVAPAEVGRVTEFLGELVGARFDDAESPPLKSARGDPMLLGEQMRRAWEDFVLAETGAGPVVLIVEDLHWGDLPTVKLIDGALRLAEDRPFFVLAFGRPEVESLFPNVWGERGVQALRLGELTRKASERLVRAILGAVPDETVARLCDRAGGNALYLEELIRATAENKRELPATVIAMMGARLEELEPEARRVLRAASVFGPVFWRGGAAALLGGDAGELREWLGILVDREVVLRRPERRFPGEEEYTFRHGLMREAAYTLLTDADRVLGHRLAAEWLAQRGEPDPVTLAEHYERGGAADRAVAHYQRAAEQALGGNDFAAAVSRAERALAGGAEGPTRAELLVLVADAQYWRGELAAAEAAAEEAMAALEPGSAAWCHALGLLAVAAAGRGNLARLVQLVDDVAARLGAAADGPLVGSAARIATDLALGGRLDLAALLVELIDAAPPLAGVADANVRGLVLGARAALALRRGDPEACHRHSRAAAACFAEVGNARMASVQLAGAAAACLSGGVYLEAETLLREALAGAERLGLAAVVASTRHDLGHTLYRLGRHAEAIEVLRRAGDAFAAAGERRLEGSVRIHLARAHRAAGDAAAAAEEATRAVELLTVAPALRALALAALAEIRLDERRAGDAADLIAEAVALLPVHPFDDGEPTVRLVEVLTLEAAGRTADARAALAAAAERVQRRFARLGPAWRAAYLAIEENARTLALAREWGVAPST